MFDTTLYSFPSSNQPQKGTWSQASLDAEVWATAKCGSTDSTANWLIMFYYHDLIGWLFKNYDDWRKSRELLFYDWPCYSCMELPIGKIQRFDKLSVYWYNPQYNPAVGFDTLVSLFCAMVDNSCRVPILHPLPRGTHSKESPTVTGGSTHCSLPFLLFRHKDASNDIT